MTHTRVRFVCAAALVLAAILPGSAGAHPVDCEDQGLAATPAAGWPADWAADDLCRDPVRSGGADATVEQNAARALEISDRGYVLELGRNRYEGSGRELLGNPDVRTMYLGGASRVS